MARDFGSGANLSSANNPVQGLMGSEYAIAFWTKQKVGGAASTYIQVAGSDGTPSVYVHDTNGGVKILLRDTGGTFDEVGSHNPFPEDTWVHTVINVPGASGKADGYRDNTLIWSEGGTRNVDAGSENCFAKFGPPDAFMAELAIWNRRLTSQERQDLADGTNPIHVASDALVRYWECRGAENAGDPEPEWFGNEDLEDIGSSQVGVTTDHPPVDQPGALTGATLTGVGSVNANLQQYIRSTQHALEVVSDPVGPVRDTQHMLEIIYELAAGPARDTQHVLEIITPWSQPFPPTVSVSDIAVDAATFTGSTYGHPEAKAHTGTRIRVYEAGTSTLVKDITEEYGSNPPGPPVHTVPGLPSSEAGTDLEVTFQYRDEDDVWGPEGGRTAFTTLAGTAPNAPVIELVTDITEDAAELHLADYSHPSDDGSAPPQEWDHVGSHFQVALASDGTNADGSYANPIFDSGMVYAPSEITWILATALAPAGAQLKAHALVQDRVGLESGWGPNHQFQLLPEPTGARPSQPTVTLDLLTFDRLEASTSAFVAGQGGAHEATRWWLAEDSGFATTVVVVTSTTDLVSWVRENLRGYAGTSLWLKARHLEQDAEWSLWSDPVEVAVPAAPMQPRFWPTNVDAPIALAGTVDVTFGRLDESALPGGFHWELEVSEDLGSTWTPLDAANTTGSHSLDSTAYADGLLLLRTKEVTDVGEETPWATEAVLVANDTPPALALTPQDQIDEVDLSQWAGQRWLDVGHRVDGPYERGEIVRRNLNFFTSTVIQQRALDVVPRDSIMTARVEFGGANGGWSWASQYCSELVAGGCGILTEGRQSTDEKPYEGVAVTIRLFPAAVYEKYHGWPGSGPGTIHIEYAGSDGHTFAKRAVSPGTLVARTEAHWETPSTRITQRRTSHYTVVMRRTVLADNPDGTQDVRVRVLLTGTHGGRLDPPQHDGYHADETFLNVPRHCGGCGYAGWQAVNAFNMRYAGWSVYHGLGLMVLEEEADSSCGCPDPPTTDAVPNALGGAVLNGYPPVA